jgi:excisionase family DNA binding protein
MPELFQENLISTSEASKLTGYNPDYLARLCRSGAIVGRRIGRTWCLNRDSLELFITQQEERKRVNAEKLSESRALEYQKRQEHLRAAVSDTATSEDISAIKPANALDSATPRKSPYVSATEAQAFFLQRRFALAVTLVVVAASSYLSTSAAFPKMANDAERLAHTFSESVVPSHGLITHEVAFLASPDRSEVVDTPVLPSLETMTAHAGASVSETTKTESLITDLNEIVAVRADAAAVRKTENEIAYARTRDALANMAASLSAVVENPREQINNARVALAT